jgi:hypothetical protein
LSGGDFKNNIHGWVIENHWNLNNPRFDKIISIMNKRKEILFCCCCISLRFLLEIPRRQLKKKDGKKARRDTLISISSQIFLAAGDVKHFGKKWRQVDEQTPAATVPVQLRLMSMANGPQFDNFLKNCVDQARVAGVISQQLRNSNFLVGFFFFHFIKEKKNSHFL